MPKASEEALFRRAGVTEIPGVSPNWRSPDPVTKPEPIEPRAVPRSQPHRCQWPQGCMTFVDRPDALCRYHERKLQEQEAQP